MKQAAVQRAGLTRGKTSALGFSVVVVIQHWSDTNWLDPVWVSFHFPVTRSVEMKLLAIECV